MEKTVLVVDDSRLSRMMIAAFIKESHPTWKFIEGGSAEEAMVNVNQAQVDLMTIDMNMPGMDGLTLGKQLKERFPAARVALVTANIQDAVRRRAQDVGMEFVAKPVSKAKILGFIDAIAG
jgi:two-component system, chemotaxis family, chemotaxis protein CheY